MLGVFLCGFVHMLGCMSVMPMSQMSMMGSHFVFTLAVMFGCFFVMLGCFAMMLGCFAMMFL